jgi:predicted nucleic acid-binding protein
MLSLIDTNVLVYRYDYRYPEKQAMANELLRRGIAEQSIRVPYQAILEFVAATTRRRGTISPLLEADVARREAEEMLSQIDVLYPAESVLRLALRGAAAYKLNWFDANLWAYAEHFGLPEILSEEFEDRRLYGSVRIRNPFVS